MRVGIFIDANTCMRSTLKLFSNPIIIIGHMCPRCKQEKRSTVPLLSRERHGLPIKRWLNLWGVFRFVYPLCARPFGLSSSKILICHYLYRSIAFNPRSRIAYVNLFFARRIETLWQQQERKKKREKKKRLYFWYPIGREKMSPDQDRSVEIDIDSVTVIIPITSL